MFGKLSFKAKMLGLCAILATLTAVVGVSTYVFTDSMRRDYEHISVINLPAYRYLGQMRNAYRTARLNATRLALENISAELRESSLQNLKDAIVDYEEATGKYDDAPWAPGEKELFEAIEKIWHADKEILGKIHTLGASPDRAAHDKLVAILEGEFGSSGKLYDKAIGDLMVFQNKEAEKWVTQAKATGDMGTLVGSVLSLLSIALALGIGFAVAQSMSRSMNHVASGLSAGAEEVASASRDIASASTELAASAAQQASALQETVSAVEEINAMVNKNAENAVRSQQASGQSRDSARGGMQAVEQMLAAIGEIDRSNAEVMSQTEASNKEIGEIVKVIAEIGNKTKVINDIVFQTRLLSFNASVEAARAGEHGKGFAVVAEEVGNLAQMSGNAAREISQLLEDSLAKVQKTVHDNTSKVERLIGVGREKIANGSQTARRCGEALEQIVRQIETVDGLVAEIATASREQAQGIQEISKALTQLDQVTQQNAAASQQTATSVEGLDSQVAVLRGLVLNLEALVKGGGQGEGLAQTSHHALRTLPTARAASHEWDDKGETGHGARAA